VYWDRLDQCKLPVRKFPKTHFERKDAMSGQPLYVRDEESRAWLQEREDKRPRRFQHHHCETREQLRMDRLVHHYESISVTGTQNAVIHSS
jgi:hypothetical protein